MFSFLRSMEDSRPFRRNGEIHSLIQTACDVNDLKELLSYQKPSFQTRPSSGLETVVAFCAAGRGGRSQTARTEKMHCDCCTAT